MQEREMSNKMQKMREEAMSNNDIIDDVLGKGGNSVRNIVDVSTECIEDIIEC